MTDNADRGVFSPCPLRDDLAEAGFIEGGASGFAAEAADELISAAEHAGGRRPMPASEETERCVPRHERRILPAGDASGPAGSPTPEETRFAKAFQADFPPGTVPGGLWSGGAAPPKGGLHSREFSKAKGGTDAAFAEAGKFAAEMAARGEGGRRIRIAGAADMPWPEGDGALWSAYGFASHLAAAHLSPITRAGARAAAREIRAEIGHGASAELARLGLRAAEGSAPQAARAILAAALPMLEGAAEVTLAALRRAQDSHEGASAAADAEIARQEEIKSASLWALGERTAEHREAAGDLERAREMAGELGRGLGLRPADEAA